MPSIESELKLQNGIIYIDECIVVPCIKVITHIVSVSMIDDD